MSTWEPVTAPEYKVIQRTALDRLDETISYLEDAAGDLDASGEADAAGEFVGAVIKLKLARTQIERARLAGAPGTPSPDRRP